MSTRTAKRIVGAAIAILIATGIGSPAFADSSLDDDGGPVDTDTIVVDGRSFGPEDGAEVTEDWVVLPEMGSGETVGLEWGATPEPGVITPLVYWGSSYAYSTEYAYVWYEGHAKAAANVYNNQRIIQVCIQFQRSGVGVADKRCSSASSNGSSWSSGPDVVSYATDSLGLEDPPTIMYIWTTRINPAIL